MFLRASGTGMKIVFVLFFLAGSGVAAEKQEFVSIPEVHLVCDPAAEGPAKIDQESFQNALRGAGYSVDPSALPITNIRLGSNKAVIVIPASSAVRLTHEEILFLVRMVRAGAVLITDTSTELSKALGIGSGSYRARVFRVYSWCRKGQALRWNDGPRVSFVSAAPDSFVLYRTADGRSLSVLRKVGLGAVVFFSTYFDPLSRYGYGRFPDLAHVLARLQIVSPFSRQGVDVYFDAGYHDGQNVERLAEMWSSWGIRAIRASIWNLNDADRYFDYRVLADAVHRNGMLIYGWAQWPYAGEGFWKKHPEWRQKNGYLKDAVVDFLYLMDFQIEACRKAILEQTENLLANSGFDGFDLAEFSITGGVDEALEGPASPANFVGFGKEARSEFRQKTGVDPVELLSASSPHYYKKDPALLNQFYAYRREANRRITESVLSELSRFNKKLGGKLDLIMTVIDNSQNPEYDQLFAMDMPFVLDQLREKGIALQVEDPTPEWAKPPDRYLALGENYRKRLQGRPFDIDINFEDNHPDGQVGFPARIPIGSEVQWLWRSAREFARNVCFYSEFHIKEIDWSRMPGAMAAGARIRREGSGWVIETPFTVQLKVEEDLPVAVDGTVWYCRNQRRLLIPAGRHRLDVLPRDLRPDGERVYLQSTTSELKSCRLSGKDIEIELESDQRSLSRFSGHFERMTVDGRKVDPQPLPRDQWLLFLPPGLHRISVSSSPR